MTKISFVRIRLARAAEEIKIRAGRNILAQRTVGSNQRVWRADGRNGNWPVRDMVKYKGGLKCCKRDDSVSPGMVLCWRKWGLYRIAIHTRRKINGYHPAIALVNLRYCPCRQALDRRSETRAENRINNQLGIQRSFNFSLLEIFFFGDPERLHGNLLEHLRGVTTQLVSSFGQNDDRDFLACFIQLAGGDESIAPVIALAADHAHGIEIKVPLGKFCHCAAGILH